MSLRIVPADNHQTTYGHIASRGVSAPSAPGLHDTLRAGVGPSPFDGLDNANASNPKPVSAHPLEARLRSWEATREALRMETLRRTYGIAEPVRRQMELKITREGEWRPMCLRAVPGGGGPGASLHEDILAGRDDTITWEDVFTGEETRPIAGFHDEMERKLKMV
ncbi:hypothetical protein VTJ49DRAFT_5999 [Mycothermus thermophilus]|uniref:Proteasome maturation factor UMP1 n=1 Tax=Humicola insolens TaxID=85995 RepID=A0ABR3VK13_HUMIN